MQSLRTELAVASVLYFPRHVDYGAEQYCGMATSKLLGDFDTEEVDGKAGLR